MTESIKEKLRKFRGRNNGYENIVFYSYKMSPHAHINQHELKRLEHSISSLREYNDTIPVYIFCDDPDFIPQHLILEYAVRVEPFVDGFDDTMLNAWSIHRWYNLQYFKEDSNNILYVDSDTIFYHDVQYLFDTYCQFDVYGREEFGFRYDPNNGGGRNIRDQLDRVDACIYDLGGKHPVYKFCLGVVLLNDNIHKSIVNNLNELSDLMEQFKSSQVLLPIPNTRIVDEYAVWILLSRLEVNTGLFGIQDVTHGYIEQKHQECFNPVVLHYTTKKEQEFASSELKYHNLIRDVDELAGDIDPYYNRMSAVKL